MTAALEALAALAEEYTEQVDRALAHAANLYAADQLDPDTFAGDALQVGGSLHWYAQCLRHALIISRALEHIKDPERQIGALRTMKAKAAQCSNDEGHEVAKRALLACVTGI